MLKVLATCLWLAAATPPEPTVVEPPRVFVNETPIAHVFGEKLPQVSFVAAHCEALQRYLQFNLGMPELPPPVARLEIADLKNFADIQARLAGGQVLVVVRVTEDEQAPQRCAEAAAVTWLARAAVAGGKPVDAFEPWVKQALAAETLALLRPAMVDFWFREGLSQPVAKVSDILQGRASDREAFLFWRALHRESKFGSEAYRVLIDAAQGQSATKYIHALAKDPESWWLVHRADLLRTRPAVSLGMMESAIALDDLTRFVFDFGKGDVAISGSAVLAHRDLPVVKATVDVKLASLRREILRQNPVYHNAWRLFGTWLERFNTASPAELDKIWADYLIERTLAEELRREVADALAAPSNKK